jgi:hypothetical protein
MFFFNRRVIDNLIVQMAYAIWIIIEIVIFLRFILMLLGASDAAAFIKWLYKFSFTFVYPFWGAFSPIKISEKGVLEISSLFAMLIYFLAVYLIVSIVDIIEGKKQNLFSDKKHS